MFSTLRKRFGTPGVIAVIALVFAMAGGAFAASGGLNGKQKKEVKKIAKKYAGKPGATGPQGSPGTNGKDGAAGPAGKDGTTGAAGATGATGSTGKTGSTGTTGSTGKTGSTGEINTGGPLPSGQTETGVFTFDEPITTGVSGKIVTMPVSLAVPLAGELTFTPPFGAPATDTALIVKKGASGVTHCSGTPTEPMADSGYMCVYIAEEPEMESEIRLFKKPGAPGTFGVGKTGTVLGFFVKKEQTTKELYGTWAVTG